MKYSIVMASYLGDYKGAARNRKEKFRRALDSVIAQTYGDWELLVVSDGCVDTMLILSEYNDQRIRCFPIDKRPTWDPTVRNFGIHEAKGEWIVYLDTDDVFGPEHLGKIGKWVERQCSMQKYRHGTGNLIHARDIYWPEGNDYDHDMRFVQELRKMAEGERLSTPEYFCCHIPNRYEV
jgi:glycosyltransferase involved in cell wall biosynthesis